MTGHTYIVYRQYPPYQRKGDPDDLWRPDVRVVGQVRGAKCERHAYSLARQFCPLPILERTKEPMQ